MPMSIPKNGMHHFTIIWVGQVASMLGSAMTWFAFTIWAWEKTGQPTLEVAGRRLFGLLPSQQKSRSCKSILFTRGSGLRPSTVAYRSSLRRQQKVRSSARQPRRQCQPDEVARQREHQESADQIGPAQDVGGRQGEQRLIAPRPEKGQHDEPEFCARCSFG